VSTLPTRRAMTLSAESESCGNEDPGLVSKRHPIPLQRRNSGPSKAVAGAMAPMNQKCPHIHHNLSRTLKRGSGLTMASSEGEGGTTDVAVFDGRSTRPQRLGDAPDERGR
jgi:hypothetical protein